MLKEEYEVLYNLEEKYWWFLGRKKVAFAMLERNLSPQQNSPQQNFTILDAGCGTGKNMEYLQKYGKVHGLDFSEEALQFCRKRGLKNLMQGEIEHLPYEDNTFDLVTCFGVLYHQGIKDDFKAIQELQRVCKPGGFVLITTPAGEFLTSRFFLSQHDKNQHTARRHSKSKLKRLLTESGLKVREISYMNMFLMPFIVCVRLMKNFFGALFFREKEFKSELQIPPRFINTSLLSLLQFENKLVKKCSLPFGLTLVSLSQKPENKHH